MTETNCSCDIKKLYKIRFMFSRNFKYIITAYYLFRFINNKLK